MNTIQRVFSVLKNVQRPGAQWIVYSRRHSTILSAEFCKLRLPSYHFLRWGPFGPFLLPLDDAFTIPVKTSPTQTNAIAHGCAIGLGPVEIKIPGVDDHRTRAVPGFVGDFAAKVFGVDEAQIDRWDREALIWQRTVDPLVSRPCFILCQSFGDVLLNFALSSGTTGKHQGSRAAEACAEFSSGYHLIRVSRSCAFT